jgi:3-deoxy-D-manno-octulosonic-acid transferase
VVLTGADAAAAAAATAAGLDLLPPLPERPETLAGFLAHWRPAAAVIGGGPLRPVLAEAAAAASVPLLWLEAAAPAVAGGGHWPRLVRRGLERMHAIHARDAAALEALHRAGAPEDRLELAGTLELPVAPPPANEPERAAIARALGTRPVWLAAALTPVELDAVAAAHFEAMRTAHRLLLVAVPEPLAEAGAMAERLSALHGLATGRRSLEAEIDEDIQVYLADTEGEYGLWYRLAPVVYLGGTLSPQGSLRDPREAAALGAAIVHGPADGGAGAAVLAELRAAAATRAVASGAELGAAIGDLLAPERAAALAYAAWAQASAGAAATSLAVQAILPLVDAAGAAGG